MYAIKQIKICAEYRDMLPRPRLDLSGTPGLRPIGLSPGSWQTSLGLGSMSRYSAQILICITPHNYMFESLVVLLSDVAIIHEIISTWQVYLYSFALCPRLQYCLLSCGKHLYDLLCLSPRPFSYQSLFLLCPYHQNFIKMTSVIHRMPCLRHIHFQVNRSRFKVTWIVWTFCRVCYVASCLLDGLTSYLTQIQPMRGQCAAHHFQVEVLLCPLFDS